jgi:CheY-like chemotaxis protein
VKPNRLSKAAVASTAKDHPLQILVVEDDRINMRFITAILTKFGYAAKKDFVCAVNGAEAVREVEKRLNLVRDGKQTAAGKPYLPFNFVLMDLQMPVMDGMTASRLINKMYRDFNLKTHASTLRKPDMLRAGRGGRNKTDNKHSSVANQSIFNLPSGMETFMESQMETMQDADVLDAEDSGMATPRSTHSQDGDDTVHRTLGLGGGQSAETGKAVMNLLRLNPKTTGADDVAITVNAEVSPLIGSGRLDTRTLSHMSLRSSRATSHGSSAPMPHPNLAGILGPCIVAVTANNTGFVKSDCRDAEFSVFVCKPVSFQKVHRILTTNVRKYAIVL